MIDPKTFHWRLTRQTWSGAEYTAPPSGDYISLSICETPDFLGRGLVFRPITTRTQLREIVRLMRGELLRELTRWDEPTRTYSPVEEP